MFYAIVFGPCLGVTALASHLGDRTPIVAMFSPLAAVLLMLLVFTRDGSNAGWQALGLHRAGLRGWGLVLLLPLVVLGFAYGSIAPLSYPFPTMNSSAPNRAHPSQQFSSNGNRPQYLGA